MPEAALRAPRLGDVLADGARQLTDAGCEAPRLDAELLLCAALGDGWTRARLVTAAHERPDQEALGRYEPLLARRRRREPVGYILGYKDFRHIRVAVDPRVLIPRPETELLVEVGLRLPAAVMVADVGTGSGAVALALADERPDLELTGIDTSADALAVARDNARQLGVNIRCAQADLLDHDRYQAVLANLPYVPDGQAGLAPEITDYEPPLALFAGTDGLAALRRLIARIEGTGVRLVALEVGAGQAPAVAGLLERAGFLLTERLRDLAGHERVVVGQR